MDIDLLNALSASLRSAQPDDSLLDPHWIEQAAGNTICPTSFNIAGRVIALAAGQLAAGAMERVAAWARDAARGDLLTVAVERLGVTLDDAARLFYRPVRADLHSTARAAPAVPALIDPEAATTAEEAANTVDRLIATGGVDWVAANPHWTAA